MTTEDAHDRRRYQRGCRCGKCCEANRVYARAHKRTKQRRLHAVAPPTTPAETEPPTKTTGPVTAAVVAQIAELPVALERPGLAAIAVRLAELLDNDAAIPQHANAAHRLAEILTTLSKYSTRKGRLSLVRTMTQAAPPETEP